MKRCFLFVVLICGDILFACGGGGGGGTPVQQLSPPAFNLTGNWTMTETITGSNCQSNPQGTYPWSATVTQANGSNTVYITDTRPNATTSAMTLSGKTLTYSVSRYNEDPADCASMTASYVVTMTTATSFSNGSGTVTCNIIGGGSCNVSTSISGHQ